MNENKNITDNPKTPDEVFCQVQLRVIRFFVEVTDTAL